jgi:hypothetical protein
LLDVAPGQVCHLGEIATRGVRVQRRGPATLATYQLIDGQAGLFALDVPQRLVDT